MGYWKPVRKDMRAVPIVEGAVRGEHNLYVERYFFQSLERSCRGLRGVGLSLNLGGTRVREGEPGRWRSETLPGHCMLIPAGCATHWHYSGPIDFANLYFADQAGGAIGRLRQLAAARGTPQTFVDAVVSANAMELTEELRKGAGADEHFMSMLVTVIVEQAYRVLTRSSRGQIAPQHAQYQRLNAVTTYVHGHLADNLSLEVLAAHAKLSVPHFRRLFQQALGVSPHRYVLGARVEQARKLLVNSRMPLSRIADECGFSSQSHLTTSFRAAHAATPSEFRAMTGSPAGVSGRG